MVRAVIYVLPGFGPVVDNPSARYVLDIGAVAGALTLILGAVYGIWRIIRWSVHLSDVLTTLPDLHEDHARAAEARERFKERLDRQEAVHQKIIDKLDAHVAWEESTKYTELDQLLEQVRRLVDPDTVDRSDRKA